MKLSTAFITRAARKKECIGPGEAANILHGRIRVAQGRGKKRDEEESAMDGACANIHVFRQLCDGESSDGPHSYTRSTFTELVHQ